MSINHSYRHCSRGKGNLKDRLSTQLTGFFLVFTEKIRLTGRLTDLLNCPFHGYNDDNYG